MSARCAAQRRVSWDPSLELAGGGVRHGVPARAHRRSPPIAAITFNFPPNYLSFPFLPSPQRVISAVPNTFCRASLVRTNTLCATRASLSRRARIWGRRANWRAPAVRAGMRGCGAHASAHGVMGAGVRFLWAPWEYGEWAHVGTGRRVARRIDERGRAWGTACPLYAPSSHVQPLKSLPTRISDTRWALAPYS